MAKIGHREGRGLMLIMSCFVHCYTSEVYGEFCFEKDLNF